jgi:hypothetical protein
MTPRLAILLVLLGATAAGCGGSSGDRPVYPVRGIVTYKGSPAAGVLVRFHARDTGEPYPLVPQGVTGEDGTFTLSTYRNGDGAFAAEYVVTFLWQGRRVDENGESHYFGPDKLQGRYSDPAKSPFTFRVSGPSQEAPTFALK